MPSPFSGPRLKIEPAQKKDVPLILRFIKELAEYERLTHEVATDEEILEETLFGERPVAEVVFAYYDNEPVGYALFFHSFSTFLGRPGIYLEDVFVRPPMRGKGVGKALLTYLARLAKERKCGRLEWAVLNWNEPSIRFYESLGAVPMDEWTVYRLSGEPLARLAEATSSSPMT
ncbi:MAG: GNAT family N-acetyltransferase [Ignavibacteria bacterium]|nr:GNAT family N-acetyltransferase [Ignavibacteria bacterium]